MQMIIVSNKTHVGRKWYAVIKSSSRLMRVENQILESCCSGAAAKITATTSNNIIRWRSESGKSWSIIFVIAILLCKRKFSVNSNKTNVIKILGICTFVRIWIFNDYQCSAVESWQSYQLAWRNVFFWKSFKCKYVRWMKMIIAEPLRS